MSRRKSFRVLRERMSPERVERNQRAAEALADDERAPVLVATQDQIDRARNAPRLPTTEGEEHLSGKSSSPVVHPKHYNVSEARCLSCNHPIECITVIEVMPANVAAAVKYLWRAGVKDPAKHVEDLKKARQYIDFEIARLGRRDRLANRGDK